MPKFFLNSWSFSSGSFILTSFSCSQQWFHGCYKLGQASNRRWGMQVLEAGLRDCSVCSALSHVLCCYKRSVCSVDSKPLRCQCPFPRISFCLVPALFPLPEGDLPHSPLQRVHGGLNCLLQFWDAGFSFPDMCPNPVPDTETNGSHNHCCHHHISLSDDIPYGWILLHSHRALWHQVDNATLCLDT